jgi:hypothetical protein
MKKGRPFPELISHHPADEPSHPAPTPRVTYYHAIYDATHIHTHTHTHTNSVPEKERRATTCFNRIDKHTHTHDLHARSVLGSRLSAHGLSSSAVKATPTNPTTQQPNHHTRTDSSAKVQTRAVIAARWLLPSRALKCCNSFSLVATSFSLSPIKSFQPNFALSLQLILAIPSTPLIFILFYG